VTLRRLLLGLTLPLALLAGAAASAERLPRTVLALYDGAREGAARDTRIHRYAEAPLNHLGYRLRYVDLSEAPPPEALTGVAAALTWFDAPPPDAAAQARWASALGDREVRLISLGDPGLSGPEAAPALSRICLAAPPRALRLSLTTRITWTNPDHIRF
jgi:hypothetical protein